MIPKVIVLDTLHIKTMATTASEKDILLLFDIDGTLTEPRSRITKDFEDFLLQDVKPFAQLGIVSGAYLERIFEQLNGPQILKQYDFIFPENGLVQIAAGVEVFRQNLVQHLGDVTIQRFVNYVLRYIGNLELPIKRGLFVDFRNGMINVCPMGQNCSFAERQIFVEFDREHKVRQKMIDDLKKEFRDTDLCFGIGGQISFDVYPRGWDKTFCLDYLVSTEKFREIHFFGDKTEPGGNDHEIYMDVRTIGHKVTSPRDTRRILCEMFNLEIN